MYILYCIFYILSILFIEHTSYLRVSSRPVTHAMQSNEWKESVGVGTSNRQCALLYDQSIGMVVGPLKAYSHCCCLYGA